MNGFFQAIADYNQALQIISRLRLWVYFIIPAMISLLVGVAMFFGVRFFGAQIGNWFISILPWSLEGQWLHTISQWLGYILVGIIGLFIFKYVLIILLAPFLSPLSQKVEHYLMDAAGDSSWSLRQIAYEAIRGLRINIRNILRELVFTVLLLLLNLIPVFGWISAPLILLLQSYYAGFGNMDFTLERHMNVKGSVQFARSNRGLAIGNGMVFIFLLMIPVLGLLIGPPLAVIAATIGSVRKLQYPNQWG